jgi:hypothetical protein
VILPNGAGGGLVVPANYKTWIYTVETETMSYGFSEPVHGWHQRPRPFTIGNQAKFALDSKRNAFLVDESGGSKRQWSRRRRGPVTLNDPGW